MSYALPVPPSENRLARAVRHGLGLSLSGAFLALPFAALAQEEAVVADETDTMVVLGTALKVETPLVETPRAASIVDREDLTERNVQKLDEALRYRAGVLSAPYGADTDTDWLKIRGFEASTYLNDVRLFKDGYYTWVLEPFGLERIEVLKGPASILYGETPPGGVVNAISKRPTEEREGLVEIQVGNRDHRQIGVDTSGPLTRDGDVRYRMVGLYSERDGVLNETHNERYYFAPSLEVDFTEDTSVTFLASIQKDDGIPTAGFFLREGTLLDTGYGDVDPATNFGEPGYDKNERMQATIGYQLEHVVSDTWEFKQSLRYSKLDLELRSTYASYYYGDGDVSRGLVYRDGNIDSIGIDNRLVGTWYTDRTENTLLVGLDIQDHDYEGLEYDSFNYSPFSFGAPLDMYRPVYGNYQPITSSQLERWSSEKRQVGFYVQDQLRLDYRWVFLAGARYDKVDVGVDGFISPSFGQRVSVERSEDYSNLSLSAGAMYLADNGLSPYVNYAESFEALTTIDNGTGDLYRPLEGKQFEIGVKYAPVEFDGYITAAVFDITQENSLVTTGGGNTTQAGEVNSQGFEIEGVAYLTDNLQFIGTYTYTDASTDETGGQGEKRAALFPRHMASVWLDYEFEGGLDGLALGGGVRYIGESVSDPRSDIVNYGGDSLTVPSYTVFDAMASYAFADGWQAQINVNNVTDEEYVSSCDYWCYYGESRSVIGSLSYRW
ncbi:MAG: TonB-dependent siderophore receptor [Halomonas sp.]|nr:TonB-dependent siderophore receptor [Halomonas sp.]